MLFFKIKTHLYYIFQLKTILASDSFETLSPISEEEEPSTETDHSELRDKRETTPPFQIGITNECVSFPNGTRTCFDDKYQTPGQWHERKERLDGMIKQLKLKLEELKVCY